MVSVAEQYMNEMHDQFKYFATWVPGTPLQIGDIGELKGTEFTHLSDLKQKGIDFKIRSDPSKISLHYASSGGFSISSIFSGDAGIPQFNLDVADAGIIVKFSKDKGVAFEAQGAEQRMIADVIKVDKAILDAYNNGRWEDDWVVISDLMLADSGTVLISQGKDAAIGLKAKIQVPKLSLANIDANFDVTYENNLNTTVICQAGLTPLFKIRGIDRGFLGIGSPHVEGMRRGKKEHDAAGIPKLMVKEIPFKPFK